MTARCPHGHRWFRCPWPANPGVTELRIAADTYHLLNALQWFANDDVFFGRLVDPLMRNPGRRYGWPGLHLTEPCA